jgi:hypothetical protein
MLMTLCLVGRTYRAEWLTSHVNGDSLEAATVLEPGNADYAHDLG